MSKKKKIFILVGMVALLVVTGYLNILLNNVAANAQGTGETTYGNFFATYRADRIATRNQTMLYLDSIIENEASSEEAKADAEAQKLALTSAMEMELQMETLIKGLGFEDAVVTNSTDNTYVFVKQAELTEVEAAKILEIVQNVSSRDATNIGVIPVE